MIFKSAFAVILLPLVAALSFSQDKPAQVLKSDTELVLVPTLVLDKSGNPVTDLQASDFTVYVDGKQQPIASFDLVQASAALPADKKGASAQSSPPTQTFTNYLDKDRAAMRLMIVLVDMVNTTPLQQEKGRRQLIDVLAKGLDAGTPTALLAWTSRGLFQLHAFTTDTGVLIAALEKLRSKQGSSAKTNITAQDLMISKTTVPSGPNPHFQADKELSDLGIFLDPMNFKAIMQGPDPCYLHCVLWTQLQAQASEQRFAMLNALNTFEAVANAYAGVPGRKSLVWLTEGVPLLAQDLMAGTFRDTSLLLNYTRVFEAMNNASMSIYPIGLNPSASGLADGTSYSPAVHYASRQNMGFAMYDREREAQMAMESLALATGGEACPESEANVEGCFKVAARESSSYYMLGVKPPAQIERKPGWHTLKVQARSGFEVRARNKFLRTALSQTAPDPHDEISNAFASPFNATALRMKAECLPSAPGGERVFQLWVDPSSLNLAGDANAKINLDIHAIAYDDSGKVLDEVSKNVAADLTQRLIARLRQDGFQMRAALKIPPTAKAQVRFLIRDNLSGKIGTVDAAISNE